MKGSKAAGDALLPHLGAGFIACPVCENPENSVLIKLVLFCMSYTGIVKNTCFIIAYPESLVLWDPLIKFNLHV